MASIARIKAVLEYLKDNQGFNVDDLFVSCKDNKVFVAGETNYVYLENLNKRIAVGELESIKFEFKECVELVPEFKNFLLNKEIEYILTSVMSEIIICTELNGEIKWQYKLLE
jgi:hypothetical protein